MRLPGPETLPDGTVRYVLVLGPKGRVLLPADLRKGLGLQQGDVITSLDGTPVASFVDIRSFLFSKHPGDSLTIAYVDVLGNQTQTTIVLASGPPQ
jgi:S1-C subfamily serine protease